MLKAKLFNSTDNRCRSLWFHPCWTPRLECYWCIRVWGGRYWLRLWSNGAWQESKQTSVTFIHSLFLWEWLNGAVGSVSHL